MTTVHRASYHLTTLLLVRFFFCIRTTHSYIFQSTIHAGTQMAIYSVLKRSIFRANQSLFLYSFLSFSLYQCIVTLENITSLLDALWDRLYWTAQALDHIMGFFLLMRPLWVNRVCLCVCTVNSAVDKRQNWTKNETWIHRVLCH